MLSLCVQVILGTIDEVEAAGGSGTTTLRVFLCGLHMFKFTNVSVTCLNNVIHLFVVDDDSSSSSCKTIVCPP